MFAFVVYAVAVWFLVAKFRRRWPGYVLSVVGLVGVMLVAYFHIKLRDWTGGRLYLGAMQMLLYPYAGLVFTVSLFIAFIPKRYPEGACRRCGYDLGGLESLGLTCPECGQRQPVMVVGDCCGLCRHNLGIRVRSHGVCPSCRFPHLPREVERATARLVSELIDPTPESALPAHDPPRNAEQQHQRRKRADQHNVDRAQLIA